MSTPKQTTSGVGNARPDAKPTKESPRRAKQATGASCGPQQAPSTSSSQANLGSPSSSQTKESAIDDSSLSSPSRITDSNADYDQIRNQTLMFFLDRLFLDSKQGKSVRSLHDLSCLFGTKEFTKEMRQIIGASRNGLKKFLESYPSLFTIEGDKVYWNQLKQDGSNGHSSGRDYTKESVDYFSKKLLQFGGSQVPIRYLFGYRSQATQEVRHVSGRNSREFRAFLGLHSDIFELIDEEFVMLKSAKPTKPDQSQSQTQTDRVCVESVISQQQQQQAEELDQSMLSIYSNTSGSESQQAQAVTDPYLNKRLALLLEDCMLKMLNIDGSDQIEITKLFNEMLNDKENNELFLKMVKHVEDLKMLIRMHPKIFKRVQTNQESGNGDYLVTLLKDSEREELELNSASAHLQHRHSISRHSTSNNDRSSSIDLSVSGPISLPLNVVSDRELAPKSSGSSATNKMQPNSAQDTTNRDTKSDTKSRLSQWANAAPFVPASIKAAQQKVAPKITEPRYLTKRSLSNLATNSAERPRQQIAPDARKSLRSYLIKANASNQAIVSNRQSNGSNSSACVGQQQQLQLQLQPQQQRPTLAQIQTQTTTSDSGSEDTRARMVSMVREASSIVSQIQSSTDAVAFDCKGYNLGLSGQITLIQFAYLPQPPSFDQHTGLSSRLDSLDHAISGELEDGPCKPEVAIFDLITNPELAFCLKPLLESDKIVKVVHDARNKSNALYKQFNIMLRNVFDTQVANLVIQQQETGKPAYKSRYISISRLCEIYGNESLNKYRSLIRSRTRYGSNGTSHPSTRSLANKTDVNYWKSRPLTEAMVYESSMDVYCLIGGVYQKLKSTLKKEYEPLFDQLNLECVLARIKPDEIRGLKKERKTDLEVIDLRRKLYSPNTSKTVLSNREIRLLRHIDLSDEVRQKIQHCPKVAKKLERLDMKRAKLAQLKDGSAPDDGNNNDQKTLDNNCGPMTYSEDEVSSSITSAADDSNQQDILSRHLESDTLSNLMDELKDKMIETSSLLESLDNDDDDAIATATSSAQLHNHLSNDDCCRCSCHKSSSSSEKGIHSISSTVSLSHASITIDDREKTSGSGSESGKESTTDTAVQCDLLS